MGFNCLKARATSRKQFTFYQKFGFILDWIVGATEQKKLLNCSAMSFVLVRNSPLLLRIILGDSDSLVFKEITDLIPFQVFLILLMLFLK